MKFVKICGIKNINEAKKCFELGADAIGLIFDNEAGIKSKISKEEAKEIIENLDKNRIIFMVNRLNNPEEINELIKFSKVNAVQLHGNITSEGAKKLRELNPNLIISKTFEVDENLDIKLIIPYLNEVDYILLDTADKKTNQFGGTGLTHDWNISKQIVEKINKKVILAGGLNESNILEALNYVKPYGVDVQSGVTDKNTKVKDLDKVKRFIEIAKSS